MSQEITGPATAGAGQGAVEPAGPQAIPTPPVGGTGQAQDPAAQAKGTTPQETPHQPASAAEDHFFDPREFESLVQTLPEDQQKHLKALHKQLQGAYTTKAQQIAAHRKKVEAYDAFVSNPVESIRQVASQYGLSLGPSQGQQQGGQQQNGAQSPWGIDPSWQPQQWGDVVGKVAEVLTPLIRQQTLQDFDPIIRNVQSMTAGNIQAQLEKIDPQWSIYEDDMRQTLREHPTLVKDPVKLYRMSVPEEVQKSKAVQEALKKMKAQTDAGKVGGASSAAPSAAAPAKVNSFQDAVEAARTQLRSQGRYP